MPCCEFYSTCPYALPLFSYNSENKWKVLSSHKIYLLGYIRSLSNYIYFPDHITYKTTKSYLFSFFLLWRKKPKRTHQVKLSKMCQRVWVINRKKERSNTISEKPSHPIKITFKRWTTSLDKYCKRETMHGVFFSFIYEKCMDIYTNDEDKRERKIKS